MFFCVCEFHCFADGNKRLTITRSTQFLLLNGYMAIAQSFMLEMENISEHVAAGKIDKELLLRIMIAIMGGTYDLDEELKLDIYDPESLCTALDGRFERLLTENKAPYGKSVTHDQ